jgi:hypothetical protein
MSKAFLFAHLSVTIGINCVAVDNVLKPVVKRISLTLADGAPMVLCIVRRTLKGRSGYGLGVVTARGESRPPELGAVFI